ncbi:hypothetical protein C8Q74DRAFT_1291907 [Fomes fomentarius]|nr:hypothetical protein C8Q74DRAFT_1291907 [Fomes fomentarius]
MSPLLTRARAAQAARAGRENHTPTGSKLLPSKIPTTTRKRKPRKSRAQTPSKPATYNLSKIKKRVPRRNTLFIQPLDGPKERQVLVDRTAPVNIVLKPMRRQTSFHPALVTMVKPEDSQQVNEVRGRRSLHVHCQPEGQSRGRTPCTRAVLLSDQNGHQSYPRSILVHRDHSAPVTPMVQPTLKARGCPSRLLENTLPLLQLPSNITIRSKNRSRSSRSRSRPPLHSRLLAVGSQLDLPPGLLYDSPSATHIDSSVKHSSRTPSPTRTTGSLVPSIPPCATSPPPVPRPHQTPASVSRHQDKSPADVKRVVQKPAQGLVARQEGWFRLRFSRIDWFFLTIYMIYFPLVLPLLARIFGFVWALFRRCLRLCLQNLRRGSSCELLVGVCAIPHQAVCPLSLVFCRYHNFCILCIDT